MTDTTLALTAAIALLFLYVFVNERNIQTLWKRVERLEQQQRETP